MVTRKLRQFLRKWALSGNYRYARRIMKRIIEIIADIKNRYPNDDFFGNFTASCRISPDKRKQYQAYNKALMTLDDESWQILKDKALKHYRDHREGQKKQGFFNQLNEAFAYRYLTNKGFKNIRFIKEDKKKRPDIEYMLEKTKFCCEVKTLGISKDEISRRGSGSVCDGKVHYSLGEGFLNKFQQAVESAWTQIKEIGPEGLVYILMRFDDIALDHYQNYRKQVIEFSNRHRFNNLYIKIGTTGNKRICITITCRGLPKRPTSTELK